MFVVTAIGSHPFQSGLVDIHTGGSPDEAVLILGHRVLGGHTDLFQCPADKHSPSNDAHTEILLLGCQSKGEVWDYTQGLR